MTDRVKIDLQCPFCGYCKIFKTSKRSGYVWCPDCKQKIFKCWATGVEGELDSHGCYYKANVPFGIQGINREFEDIFYDSFTYFVR